jgi:hypothetical protein
MAANSSSTKQTNDKVGMKLTSNDRRYYRAKICKEITFVDFIEDKLYRMVLKGEKKTSSLVKENIKKGKITSTQRKNVIHHNLPSGAPHSPCAGSPLSIFLFFYCFFPFINTVNDLIRFDEVPYFGTVL